jgi:RND family efflux transporter MFP subunit
MKKKKFGRKGVLITAISAGVVLIIVIACVVSTKAGNTKMGVPYMTLQKTTLQNSVNVTGKISSNSSANVYTTLTLPVKKVSASVGDSVKKGDILAVLDTSSLEDDMKQQEDAVKAANTSASLAVIRAKDDYESALKQYGSDTGTETAAAQNNLAAAEAALNAEQQTYSAMKKKAAGGLVPQKDLDAQGMKVSQAQQAVSSAQQAAASAKGQAQQALKAAKAAYDDALAKSSDKSSSAALEKLQKQMQQAVITAPMDGTVTQCGAAVGDIPKTALFRVENTSDLTVEAEVKEIDVDKVKTGTDVSITTDATGKDKIAGKIVQVAPAATEASAAMPNAGTQSSEPTFTVKAHITDKNPNLKIGMKAKVSIVLEQKKDVFAVSYDTIVEKPDGSQVIYAAKPDGALYKTVEIPIKTGLETDVSTEITGSGLQNGMKIITGTDKIAAGQIVQLSSSSSSKGE